MSEMNHRATADEAHGQSTRAGDDLSYIFNELEDIEVDADGKCNWTSVANAATLMRVELKRALADWQNGFRAALSPSSTAGESDNELRQLIGYWNEEAKRHLDAKKDGDVADEEYFLNEQSARVYQICATALEKTLHTPVECAEPGDAEDRMIQIEKLIADLQSIKDRFGNTCVYIRRGGLSWGAVALNRRDDDQKHGVFDLQAQHDRDMLARLEQIERLKKDRDEWRQKVWDAEKTSQSPAGSEA